ncbi:MAG: translocation/assembly module TamB [Bacteroidales bacterium]|nr:translocation/assembly module TamB [Bacteroidales bacterium]
MAIRKFIDIALRVLVGTAMVAAAVCLLLQLPAVQKFALQKALDRIESSIDGRLEVDAIDVQPFDAARLEGVRIIDLNPLQFEDSKDTLFSAEKLYASFDLRSIIGGQGFHLGKVSLENASMNLVLEHGEYKDNLSRIFHLKPKGKKPGPKEIFSIRRISARNLDFHMLHPESTVPYRGSGINWNDLHVVGDIEGHAMRFADRIMSFAADHIALTEQSGCGIEHISGRGRVGRGETLLENLHMIDSWSDINLPVYKMSYENTKAFSRFVDAVTIDAKIGKTTLSPATLTAIIGLMPMNGITLDIDRGTMSGPVSNFMVSDLSFTEKSSGIHAIVEGSMKGLPRIDATELDAKVNLSNLRSSGLGKIVTAILPKAKIDLGKFAKGQAFSMTVSGKGTFNKLAVKAGLKEGGSAMNADLSIGSLLSGNPEFRGSITSRDLDLGRLTGISALGRCSLDSGLEASFGKSGTSMRIDSLQIGKLGLLGYEYSGIQANGTFDGSAFDGRVVCSDPNLNFMLQGLVNLDRKAKNAVFNFIASIGYADLHAMNIDKREVSKVSLNSFRADLTSKGKGELDGNLTARGLVFESTAGMHDIGDIAMRATTNARRYSIRLNSGFADADYDGSVGIVDMLDEIKRISIGRELNALLDGKSISGNGEQGSLDVRFHDSRDLMAFIRPGVYIADSTRIRVSVDNNGVLGGTMISPRLALREKYLRRLEVNLDNKDNALNCKLYADELNLMPALNFKNSSVLLYANDNNVGLGCYYDNGDDNRADIYLTADMTRDTEKELCVNAHSLASNIYFNGERWNIRPSSGFYRKGDFSIDRLSIENGEQSISLTGGISIENRDSLRLDIGSLDLSMFNGILADRYELGGHATGEALLISPLGYDDELGLSVDLTVEDTWLGGYPAGTLLAESSWNEESKALDILVRNEMDSSSPLTITGSYTPGTKAISADARLDSFEAGYFSPLAASVFSTLEGKVSGVFHVDGTPDRLAISSENGRINGGLLQIGYTGVPYYLDGGFMVSDRGVFLSEISARDSRNGRGSISGGVLFNNFKDMRMDMQMRFEDMECTRMAETDGVPFYGRLYGTGRLNISGPFNALFLDAEVTTSSAGNLHIPLNAVASSGTSDLLTFKEPERAVYIDPYDIMMNRLGKEEAMRSDLGLRFKVSATPSVDVMLEIDKSSGHALTGRGSGALTLEVRPSRDLFSINGDYTLNSGDYHFAAMGIAQRDFSIQDGSSVKFNGDIMDSDLDIDAMYITKASLSNLIADTTSVSTRRNVECGIHISDKIRNPALGFSINVPDLDPVTKSRVEGALNTEDKIQKQFVALLISNNFLPDEQSGVTNNSSSILYSNVAEIMANQLNNILMKLDIPLDLGLNYQATQGGTSIFDVAISTQLFNNRAVINGTIGNRQRSGNEDVVGDIDIEVKLDKTGQLRLTLFSHSADDYTNYLDNSQRSGVGVAYQKEFSSLAEFIRRLFMSKARRAEEDLQRAMTTEETVLMGIE